MNLRPKIIGITGGVSSGKSTIARMLSSLGAECIDADEMCHKLLFTKNIKDMVVEKFGIKILDSYGKIDRLRLAEIVFQDKTYLNTLCEILHPVVISQIKSKINKIEKTVRKKAIVIDAALLEESELSLICDFIVFVNTIKENRLNRCKISKNWTEGELEKREQFQMCLEDKKKKADYIIDNNSNVDNTFGQVNKFWQYYIDEN